jgi:hypothetical protein
MGVDARAMEDAAIVVNIEIRKGKILFFVNLNQ